MQKIGIVTTYQNVNYGSKLQSYALQKTLKMLGFRGENIQIIRKQCNQKNNRLKKLINNPLIIKEYILREYIFKRKLNARKDIFENYLLCYINESEFNTKKLKEHPNNYYFKYICGSDQIWAPNQFNEDFFLAFIKQKNKKVAYAPSIGLPSIPPELRDKYIKLLNDIEHISIREKDGAKMIEELTGRHVDVVLDPTLLLTREIWSKHIVPYKCSSSYILCYFLGNNKSHRKWVKEFAKVNGYKIVVLPFSSVDYFWGDIRVFNAGPREFLGLINNAKIICTDSYHGMLFSVIFNKTFYSFLRFKKTDKLNQNSRVLNFVEKFHLENRIVDFNNNNKYEEIIWKEINDKIECERDKSITYLKNALI